MLQNLRWKYAFLCLLHSFTNPALVGGAFQKQADRLEYCTNDTVNMYPECWGYLAIDNYLYDWWQENSESCNMVPYNGSGFASRYQQKHRATDQFCNNITLANCYPLPRPDESPATYAPAQPDDWSTVQERYVLQSIFAIWWWFNSMWVAVEDGTLLADLPLTAIVEEINPVLPGAASKGVMLSALSAGLAFLGLRAGVQQASFSQRHLPKLLGLPNPFYIPAPLTVRLLRLVK